MSRVGVYDADFIPFYVCNNKDKTIEKTLDECIEHCDSLIDNMNKAIFCEYFTGFLTKGKCFRYNVYPEYKGNRKYDNMPTYLKEVREHLMKHYNFTYCEGFEADDLVVSYKQQSKDECIIISPDKDILNLEGIHYNPRKNEYVATDKDTADLYFWKSMVIGDSTDNIKGIKGVGPAGADKLVKNKGLFSSLKATVLDKYCEVFGDEEGITQFYINYKCLKIVNHAPVNVELNKTELICE